MFVECSIVSQSRQIRRCSVRIQLQISEGLLDYSQKSPEKVCFPCSPFSPFSTQFLLFPATEEYLFPSSDRKIVVNSVHEGGPTYLRAYAENGLDGDDVSDDGESFSTITNRRATRTRRGSPARSSVSSVRRVTTSSNNRQEDILPALDGDLTDTEELFSKRIFTDSNTEPNTNRRTFTKTVTVTRNGTGGTHSTIRRVNQSGGGLSSLASSAGRFAGSVAALPVKAVSSLASTGGSALSLVTAAPGKIVNGIGYGLNTLVVKPVKYAGYAAQNGYVTVASDPMKKEITHSIPGSTTPSLRSTVSLHPMETPRGTDRLLRELREPGEPGI